MRPDQVRQALTAEPPLSPGAKLYSRRVFARITRARARSLPVTEATLDSIHDLMSTVSVLSGHQGAAWLLNRKTGEAAAIDFYRDADNLENTSQGDLREALAEALDVEVLAVDEFEVVGLDRLLERASR
jgi:hypothetical protein